MQLPCCGRSREILIPLSLFLWGWRDNPPHKPEARGDEGRRGRVESRRGACPQAHIPSADASSLVASGWRPKASLPDTT